MAEVGISVAAKIAEYLVDPIVRPIISYARYLFCFNNVHGDFQKSKAELESTHQVIKQRADEAATRNAEKIAEPVEKWLNDVQKVLEELQNQFQRVEASKRCLNVKLRYSLARKMANMTQQMNDLNKNSEIEPFKTQPFSRPVELQRMKYFSSKDFGWFDSTKSAYDKLLVAIRDDKLNMIGLVGMGGCGKTSLAKMVGKRIENSKHFDKVVMTTVSQDPKVRVIQGEIADQLSFTLEKETECGRARELSKRLKTEKILVILDDVWKKLNLEEIGIPLDETNNNCSILLTTRKQDVCTLMECKRIIELSTLTDDEGWNLFKQCAQIDDSPEKLKVVAKRIANKCQGLLIAIVTVGSTLKGRNFDRWDMACSTLEESQPIEVPEGLTSPYACLKLSYDNLTNNLAKSLFLLCGMFPEDHEIHLEDLFRYGWGVMQELGLTNSSIMETTRGKFKEAVGTLIDCCLLKTTDEKERVLKMHDMVRDVALWIASNEGQTIMVVHKEIPRFLKKDTKIISIWDLRNSEFPYQLLCPTLQILLQQCAHYNDNGIPNTYLEGYKDLKVLALIAHNNMNVVSFGMTLPLSIPQSIGSLTNLRSLCLRGYKLGDISILGSIKGLEILDLRNSSFTELPKEIGTSNKLKLLDLYKCGIEKGNPYEVITRCSGLEELYIQTIGEFSLENVSFPTLQRYKIWQHYKRGEIEEEYYEKRFLCVEAKYLSNLSVKDLFLRADGLHLKQIREGNKNIILSMDKQQMNQVTSLILENCSGIDYLIDTNISVDVDVIQEDDVFSNLELLWLREMLDLKELFRDPSSSCPMKMLQELRIENCPLLCSVSFPGKSNLCCLKILTLSNCPELAGTLFTPSIAQTPMALEELYIRKCRKLQFIIAEDKEEENVNCSSNQDPCPRAFGHLKTLKVHHCDNLESLFPILFAQNLVSLENLSIKYNSMLKSVFGSSDGHWLSSHSNHSSNVLGMPALRSLILNGLPNLHLCTEHYYSSTIKRHVVWVVATTFSQLCPEALPTALQEFLNLKTLHIHHLERLDGIFELQAEHNNEQESLKLSSDLFWLDCEDLFELKFIWNGPANILSLHRLKFVSLFSCSKLKTIFSATIVTRLPELSRLTVWDCDELEEIISFDSDEAGQLRNLSTHSQQLCFPKLTDIEIKRCGKLKCIFSYSLACHCPYLGELSILSCSQLEQVVKFEHKATGDEGGGGAAFDDKDGKHELFPELLQLVLLDLPNLTWIYPNYELKSLHKIHGCPKYNLFGKST